MSGAASRMSGAAPRMSGAASRMSGAASRMSGAASRRKGAEFERALVHRFREAMPTASVRRGLQSRSGAEVPDVDVPCFWPELKRHKRTNPREALRQAVNSCPKGRWPIGICKDDGEPAFVVIGLEDFLDLVSEWWEGRR